MLTAWGSLAAWPPLEQLTSPWLACSCWPWRMCRTCQCGQSGPYVQYGEHSLQSSWESQSWSRTLCLWCLNIVRKREHFSYTRIDKVKRLRYTRNASSLKLLTAANDAPISLEQALKADLTNPGTPYEAQQSTASSALFIQSGDTHMPLSFFSNTNQQRTPYLTFATGINRPFATMGHVTYPPLNLILGTLWILEMEEAGKNV